MSTAQTIRVLCTGGTIDKAVDNFDTSRNVVGEPQIERILAHSNTRFLYVVESICKKDSLALTEEDRALLLSRVQSCSETKIVITHGTDTATDSAKLLQSVEGKTIVFVGAMFPAKFIDSDAAFNVGGAIIAVQLLPPGVYLVANGLVLNPFQVKKSVETLDYQPIK